MKVSDCVFQLLCFLLLAQVHASCATTGQSLNGCCECAGDRKGTVHLNQIKCSRRDTAHNLIFSVNAFAWPATDWTGSTFHCEANEYCQLGSTVEHPNNYNLGPIGWKGEDVVKKDLCRTAPENRCYCTGVGNQIACNTNNFGGSCSGGGDNCQLSPPVEIRWCAVNEVCYSRSNNGFTYGKWGQGCKKATGRRRQAMIEENPVCQYYPSDLSGTNDLWASPCSFWPESMCENHDELGVCVQCGKCTGAPKFNSEPSLACESHPSTSSEDSESVYATSSCSEWEKEMGQRMCGRDVMKVCAHCGHCNTQSDKSAVSYKTDELKRTSTKVKQALLSLTGAN